MNIGIYNPYFDSLSGGERYSLQLASCWSKNHTVSVFWDDAQMLAKAQKRLNLDLSRVNVAKNIFKGKNLINKMLSSKRYDLIFFLSDGSIPTTLARHNILHFQVPFRHVAFNAVKFRQYDAVICNSEFTKRHLDMRVAKNARVIYPPAEMVRNNGKKQHVILSVGRFSGHFHSTKKQEVLIEAFRRAHETILQGWKLVLAGGLLPTDKSYYEGLVRQASGLPISFYPNINHADLIELYQQSTFYWHAAGFGETEPEKMEHFGITTVEAMSAGCIPFAYRAGGQTEIISDATDGYVWQKIDELLEKTGHAITNSKKSKSMSQRAVQKAKSFSVDEFCGKFNTLLHDICA